VRPVLYHSLEHAPPHYVPPQDGTLAPVAWPAKSVEVRPFLVIVEKGAVEPRGHVHARVYYLALFGWVRPVAGRIERTQIIRE
jgi:hypothetical protein